MVIIVLAVAFLLAGCEKQPSEKAYPDRSIKLVVPFDAGGGTDVFARIIKRAIDEHDLLPQPLVIINQGGAGATIGSRRVKDAPPDGYTVLILHNALMTAKFFGTVDYGPEAFEPVAATGEVGMVIAVAEDSPFQALDDLLEQARDQPDTIKFAANIGAMTDFARGQLETACPGAMFRYAQFGGGAERFANLKGGIVDVTGFSIEEFVRFRSEGLRGLAYFGEQRCAAAPDVPTAIEQGYDVISRNTFYWWCPKGTPQERINVLADALEAAMQTELVQQRMSELHTDAVFLKGTALREHIDEATRRVAQVALRETFRPPNFPAYVGAAILGLIAVIAVQSRRRRTQDPHRNDGANGDSTTDDRRGLAVFCALSTVAYAAVLQWQLLPFAWTTAAYVLVLGGVLTQHRRHFPAIVAAAFLLGFGIQFVMTRVFEIDLP